MLETPARRSEIRRPQPRSTGSRAAAEFLRHYGRQLGLPLVVAVLIGFFATASEVFFSIPNFHNIGVAAAALAAVSFGQTFTILTAGLDLSVGSTVALASVIGAFAMRNHGISAGILAALLTGSAVGIFNGLVITQFRVFPFIATLATLSIASGLALSLSGGVPVTGLPVVFTDLAYEVHPRRAGAGRDRRAGADRLLPDPALHANRTAHVCRRRQRAGGAALRHQDRGRQARRLHALRLLRRHRLDHSHRTGRLGPTRRWEPAFRSKSVAAVVLGGVSLFGGRGSVIGVAFGVLFVSILSNGLNLLNVSSYTQMMVIGGALILAVALDQAMVGERSGQ